jgi:predicted nuclease of predicted toxin-antitoxin system
VRFLLDQNRSPALARLLQAAGHDAVHLSELGLSSAEDGVVLDEARRQRRVVISADTDFGALIALRNSTRPSVILFRARTLRSASEQFEVLRELIKTFEHDLAGGCILIIGDENVRVRQLPLLDL